MKRKVQFLPCRVGLREILIALAGVMFLLVLINQSLLGFFVASTIPLEDERFLWFEDPVFETLREQYIDPELDEDGPFWFQETDQYYLLGDYDKALLSELFGEEEEVEEVGAEGEEVIEGEELKELGELEELEDGEEEPVEEVFEDISLEEGIEEVPAEEVIEEPIEETEPVEEVIEEEGGGEEFKELEELEDGEEELVGEG